MVCNFYVRVKAKVSFDKKTALKIISAAAKVLKLKDNFEITVLLVESPKIRDLNKRFRGKDKATDVLAFSHKEGQSLFYPKNEPQYLGDIIICYSVLKKQAKLFGHSVEKEFAFLLCHGFLHLLGYDDTTKKEYKQMEIIQNKVLTQTYDQDKKTGQ